MGNIILGVNLVGEVLQGWEGQSSPYHPGSSNNWGVENSVLGEQVGEVLQGKERQSSPSHPGINNWGVRNSFQGVNKWGRCCKAG